MEEPSGFETFLNHFLQYKHDIHGFAVEENLKKLQLTL